MFKKKRLASFERGVRLGDNMNTKKLPQIVRLLEPLSGRYCNFEAGEEVKIKESLTGQWTVERAKWRNSCQICNVLRGVPSHLLITEEIT